MSVIASTEKALVRLEEFMDTLVDIPQDIQRTLTKLREVDAKEQHYTTKYHQSIDTLLQMDSSKDAQTAVKDAYEQLLLSLTVAEESKDLGLELSFKGKTHGDKLENILLQFEEDMRSARRNGDLIADFERQDDEGAHSSSPSNPTESGDAEESNAGRGRSRGNGSRKNSVSDSNSKKRKTSATSAGEKTESNGNGGGTVKKTYRRRGSVIDPDEPRLATFGEFDNVPRIKPTDPATRPKFKFISENDSFRDDGKEEGDLEELEATPPNDAFPIGATSAQPLRALPPAGKDGNEPTYCFCNQVSFGEMIACDNEDCEKEWFHYGCVGLTAPPRGKWYCPDCASMHPQ